MSQTWEQALVNAQVEINRAVFEMNRPGGLKTDPWYAEQPDVLVVRDRAKAAMEALDECLSMLPQSQARLFPRRRK